MKLWLLRLVFLPSLSFAASNGGDVVNNGGGLSEQAIIYVAQHYRFFTESCLRYDNCGAKEPLRSHLKKLQICTVPALSNIRFAVAKEVPELSSGVAYVLLANGHFVINREKIYTSNREALRVPDAFGYLSRIYFDHCGMIKFSQSAEAAKAITAFTNADGEQVTIGKDSIKIPAQEWIKIRTMYSDLLIEGPKSLLRLSCPSGELNACTLIDTSDGKIGSRFKNLSLSQESIANGFLHFEVQGSFMGANHSREYFKLSASYRDGEPLEIKLQGQNLELPPQ
ncbi:MAG: hypothetical protein IPM97_01385 [Bdellovibrionaceae bacterium]|nr:hypothetical protein [Pseudobdellovibrionaceae bacterium]